MSTLDDTSPDPTTAMGRSALLARFVTSGEHHKLRLFREALDALRDSRNSEPDRWLPRLLEAFGAGIVVGGVLTVASLGVLPW